MPATIDVLGAPWTAETIHFPPDDEGPVVATLVQRATSSPRANRRFTSASAANEFSPSAYVRRIASSSIMSRARP